MPVDRNGQRLHCGDVVSIPGVVRGLDQHSDYINIVIEPTEPMYPGNAKVPLIINARQVELVESLGDSAFDVDVSHALSDSGTMKAYSHDTEKIKGRETENH